MQVLAINNAGAGRLGFKDVQSAGQMRPEDPFSNFMTILLCCAGHSTVASSNIEHARMDLFIAASSG